MILSVEQNCIYVVESSHNFLSFVSLGVLFCSVAFGLATNAAKEKGIPFRNFFASLGEVVMLLMQKFLL